MKSSKAIFVFIIGLLAMMMTSCSSETEKKLNGQWEASEYDSDSGDFLKIKLNLDHASADGKITFSASGVQIFTMPISWFADEKEMDVTFEYDDVDWGEIDEASGRLLIGSMFGATSDGDAKWPISRLSDDNVTLTISGGEVDFERVSSNSGL